MRCMVRYVLQCVARWGAVRVAACCSVLLGGVRYVLQRVADPHHTPSCLINVDVLNVSKSSCFGGLLCVVQYALQCVADPKHT